MNPEGEQAPDDGNSPDSPTAEKRKGPGRPRRTDWQEKFLKAFGSLGTVKYAAQLAGVSRDTVGEERLRNPEFERRYKLSVEDGADTLEQILTKFANGVPTTKTVTKTHADGSVEVTVTESVERSATAAIFLLKGTRPWKYRDNLAVEQTGEVGVRLKVEREGTIDRAIDGIMDELAPRREARSAREAEGGEVAAGGASGAASS